MTPELPKPGASASLTKVDGRLTVTLFLSKERIETVDVASSRMTGASRVLADKPVSRSLAALPLLFSVCGTAQTYAGLLAAENAMGISVHPAVATARKLLVMRETIAEHATRLCLDWPILGAEPADPGRAREIRTILGDIPTLLFPERDGLTLGGGPLGTGKRRELFDRITEARVALSHLVVGRGGPPPWEGASADPSAPRSSDAPEQALRAWADAGGTAPARLFARLWSEGLAGFGAASTDFMPAFQIHDLETRLAGDASGAFRARPTWFGRVFETGPLARMVTHPAVAPLHTRYRSGLLPRFAARLAEAYDVLDRMEDSVDSLPPHPVFRPQGDVALSKENAVGVGIGVVEAARGRLVHRVRVAGGYVTDYKILAPTEWNFHPDGPFVRGLTGTAIPDADHAVALCRYLVSSLDPCVAWESRIADAKTQSG